MNRNKKLGLVHKGARKLLSIADGSKREEQLGRSLYEDWIYRRTGSRSAKQLTDKQLSRLIGELRRAGALEYLVPGAKSGGVTGAGRAGS